MAVHHHPDGWTILKFVEGDGVVYKIFATWRWDNDKWRLSSGATDLSGLSKNGGEFIWLQTSGSIYHLPIGGENCCTFYQSMILENLKERFGNEKIQYEIVSLSEFYRVT